LFRRPSDDYIGTRTGELPGVQMLNQTNVRTEGISMSEPTRIDKVLPEDVEDLRSIFEVERERGIVYDTDG
jgi:DNA-binding transcriptional ArsR family regulator